MIAHRGGFNLDKKTENSISNSLYTLHHFPSIPLEIDLYYYRENLYITHNSDQLSIDSLLLSNYLQNLNLDLHILYLDIKMDNKPPLERLIVYLLSNIYAYPRIEFFIHSNDYELIDTLLNKYHYSKIGFLWNRNKNSIKSVLNYPYLYIVMNQNDISFYKNIAHLLSIPIYWYTFSNQLEWKMFQRDYQLPQNHKGFIDLFL